MKKNKKVLIKALIEEKLFFMILGSLIVITLLYFFEYNFESIIINSILLYLAGAYFYHLFVCGPIQLYANPFIKQHKLKNKDLTSQKLRELDLRLKLEYPKMFTYYRTLMSIQLLTKIVAFLMFMYGIAQLM